MKRLTSLVTALLVLTAGLSTVRAQNTRYFDVNDDAAGSGVADNNAYTWDTIVTTGTGGWNANSDGTGAAPGQTVAWVNGDDAVFSAGTDAIGARYGLNITAGTTARNITIEDGQVLINGGTWSMTGTTEILAGATLETKASAQFAATGAIKISGGRILGSNIGSAGTIVNNAIPWEINGTATVQYDNGDSINDNVVSIINGTIITGTGGTPTNGGAGTLIKTGPDQIGYAPRDIGGVSSAAQNSFAKVVVKQGTFRLRNATINGVAGITDERLYGAVPLVLTPDAITLDGGGTGTNTTVTLNANRGLTITANGGFLDNGAGAGLIFLAPITAAPGAVLTIGSPTSTSVANTRMEFSNTTDTTTFQGDLFMLKSTLRLNAGSDLNVKHFSGVGFSAAAWGQVEVSAATTLTAGLDNQDSTFDGQIKNNTTTAGTGGIFKWDGTGTLTLNPTTSEWTNTGGVNINKGQIKYTTTAAGFATLCPVTIGSTAKLNMNGISDTFGSLSGPAGAVVDLKDTAATAGNLTLGATSGSTTYTGTIVGGGNLTKGNAASTATQVLAGNTSLGTVAVSFGTLLNNATMTTSGGVTVGAAGTLGGTGTIVGAIGNGGIIAPGSTGVGTLAVTGNVTNSAGSSWSIDLSGATADKLAVAGNIDLTAADTLNVTGAGTGTSWLIGTYTGTETGVFDTITAGYSVTYTGGNITLNAAAVGLPGDFNSDGKVDAGDYVTWRKNNGTNNALANDNGLGTPVGPNHFTLWRANFGKPPGAGSGGGLSGAAVPEPTSICLLLSSLGFLAIGRRRTR